MASNSSKTSSSEKTDIVRLNINQVRLVTSAGLANRIRAIDSALNLSRLLQASLHVEWTPDDGLFAEYEDLFLPTSRFHVSKRGASRRNRLSSLSRQLSLMCGRSFVFTDADRFSENGGHFAHQSSPTERYWTRFPIAKLGRQCRELFIETIHEFCYPEDYSWLAPNEAVNSIAMPFLSQLRRSPSVGIHIRRGDHRVAVSQSPTDCFIHEMQRRLSNSMNTLFFVASDDVDVIQVLAKEFGDAVVSISFGKVARRRDNLEDMRLAVADLWCLSRCDEVWGSCGSSYSQLAFRLGAEVFVEMTPNGLDWQKARRRYKAVVGRSGT